MPARHSQATLPAFLPESLPRMSPSLSPHTDADPELTSATEPMKLYRVYLFSHLSPFQMLSSPRARALSSTPSEEALTGGVGGVVERRGMCLPLPVLPRLVVSRTVPQGLWPLTVSISTPHQPALISETKFTCVCARNNSPNLQRSRKNSL